MSPHLKIHRQLVFAALLVPATSLCAQEIDIRFPEQQTSMTVTGSLTDLSPTYVFSGVAAGQEAEASLHSEHSRVIFCRSEIDTSQRTSERTSAFEGKLYFCIENLDWDSGRATDFTLTVTLLPSQPPGITPLPETSYGPARHPPPAE